MYLTQTVDTTLNTRAVWDAAEITLPLCADLQSLYLRELLCPAGVDVSWAALKLLPKQMHRSSPRAALPPSVSSLSLRKLQHKPVALALPLLKVAHFPTDLCALALEIPLPEFLSGQVSYSPGDLTWAGWASLLRCSCLPWSPQAKRAANMRVLGIVIEGVPGGLAFTMKNSHLCPEGQGPVCQFLMCPVTARYHVAKPYAQYTA